MKKLIMVLLMGTLFFCANAQMVENDCIKGEIIGITPENKAILQMTNKQSCLADIGYDIGVDNIADKHVLAGASDTFEIVVPPAGVMLLLETNTNCSGNCGTEHLELFVKIVNTPVTGLETFEAKYNKDSAKIFLSWTTYTEVDNKGFLITNHGNPVPLGAVPSKALGGFSADPILYRASIDVRNNDKFQILGINWLIMIMFLLFIAMVFSVLKGKRMALILLFCIEFSLLACKKDKEVEIHGSYTLQLDQVDNNGTYTHGPTRKVVF